MATRNMAYRKRHFGLLDEEVSFQLDRMFRIAAQGSERKVRCDKVYETEAIRQKAYRLRKKASQCPLTPGQWEMLTRVFIDGLKRQNLTRRQVIAHAMNTLLRAHGTGLCIELTDPATR